MFTIDGTGKVLAASTPGAAVGTEIDPDQITGTFQTGTATDLMLLAPAGARYRVERVFSAQVEVR